MMSAQLDTTPRFRRMTESDLDAVMAIEEKVYTHPWTRGNFADSLAARNQCCVLEWHGVMAGYAILMTGAGEAHLLNLSIASAWQRRGLGRALLGYIVGVARDMSVRKIFLEVRVSNTAARALYAESRFREIGVRRGYYPAHSGREDAIVLEYTL
jgi:ribosomal-protein-alanine N-acetyltransferase